MMQSSNLRGIVAMLGAVLFLSLMDVALKQLSTSYPPMQVAFLRGLSGLVFVLAATGVQRDWRVIVPVRWKLHVLRGLLSVVTLYSFVYAVRILSLADAYSIFLVAPLVATALAMPLLGEQVGWRRWAAICVGLAGAVIILRPSGDSLITMGGIAALVAAIGYALGVVLIRVASRTDTAMATVFWTLLVLTAASGALAVPGWIDLRFEHWGWVLWIGVAGAIGQVLLTQAFRRCAASVVAPFEYTALLWGVMLDWLIWHVLPNQRMLLGGAIVVCSGLYVIFHERAQSGGAANELHP